MTMLAWMAAALLPTAATADSIYKYQDENGIWHFTDRLPDREIPFETIITQAEPEQRLHLRKTGTKFEPIYLLFNDFWGPVEVELSIREAVNVLSEPQLPLRAVVPAQTEQVLVGLGPLDKRKGFGYQLIMKSVPGRPISRPIGGLVLLPPFAAGEQYLVSQGFKGGTTHLTPDSEFAIDITMPIGAAVHAVRGGVVMDMEEDFHRGGTDLEKFGDKANHVRILHDDGTMALYAHLDMASVFVRRGARVRAGQKIARSGNTGFSSGPHLHFAIQQNAGMQLISVPFRFKSDEGTPVTPVAGQMLKGARNAP
jgi:hypothetical protein